MSHPIPIAALDDRLAILGTAGAGKTYAALGAEELLLARKSRVVHVDPLGVAWGLRLLADGKTPSAFDVVIFGGSHADLPINEHAGALVGETVATMAESCIIDLSLLGTKAAERRFMLPFLSALYRHKTQAPLHLVIDEADMFAPQKILDKEADAAKLLGMMETIVRRGRVKGFIPWLITQRPAVLNKDVLSQADGLVALKLTASQDRKAIKDWVESTADVGQWKEIDGQLPAMQRGQGVVWIPGRGILKTVSFPEKTTFDSSKAPDRHGKAAPVDLKPLNIDALKGRLAAVEAETKANDPKLLKARIAELERDAKKRAQNTTENITQADVTAAEQRGYERGHDEGGDAIMRSVASLAADLADSIGRAESACADSKRLLSSFAGFIEEAGKNRIAQRYTPPRSQTREPRRPIAKVLVPANSDDLTSPQRRVMASLGFWNSIGHDAPTREQVAAVAGYRPGSGNFNNLVGGLSTLGKLTVPQSGRLSLLVEYGEMTMAEARDKLLSVFENPQRRLVDAALDAERDLSREELAHAAGYAPGSGNFNNIAGSLTTMDVLRRTSVGRLELSDWAREVLDS